jgi:ParB/RepB/Spo0J family partition protein
MSQLLATPEINVADIDVVPGLNVRKKIDPDALKRLARTIKRTGVVEPVIVRPADADRYTLTAGHRRFAAAQLAGLKKVPVVVRDSDDVRTTGFVENIHQEALNAVEEGEGLNDLAADLGLTTNKAIADEVGMSAGWVAVRRRVMKLPEGAREAIADGIIPLDAEPLLRKIAEVSPRASECVCEVFARGETETGDFDHDFEELLYVVAEGNIDNPPTLIDPERIKVSEVFDEGAKLDEVRSRLATLSRVKVPDPIVTLGEAEITVARAAGVLLEYHGEAGDFPFAITYITDRDYAADLVLVAIGRREKEEKKRKKEEDKRRKEVEDAGPESEPDAAPVDEKDKERKKKKELEAEWQSAARGYNDRLGIALIKRHTPESRKKFGLARMKALLVALVENDHALAAAGIRLVMPQMQGLQPEAAEGEDTGDGKATYAIRSQAQAFVIGKIDRAKSVGELVEFGADLQIAALLADDEALNAGESVFRFAKGDERAREYLADEIKAVAPRRSPKQRKED